MILLRWDVLRCIQIRPTHPEGFQAFRGGQNGRNQAKFDQRGGGVSELECLVRKALPAAGVGF